MARAAPSLLLDPSGFHLTAPGFPGSEGWFGGFTTIRAGGTLQGVLSRLRLEDLPVFRPVQVHGGGVLKIDGTHRAPGFVGKGDGLITDRRGVVLAVAAADCVPLLLFGPRIPCGAVLHAGWRGTLAGISGEALGGLEREWGIRPDELRAVIGPCIGPCCYRVGPEVIGAFRRKGIFFDGMVRSSEGADFLDLPGANRWLLERAGVPSEDILVSRLCTRCRPDLFPSYRREGPRAGRLLGFLGSARP